MRLVHHASPAPTDQQPRPTEAPAADNNSGAPRLLDHLHSILAGPDVAICRTGTPVGSRCSTSQRDSRPVCLPAVKLRGGARALQLLHESIRGTDDQRRSPCASSHGYGQRHRTQCARRNGVAPIKSATRSRFQGAPRPHPLRVTFAPAHVEIIVIRLILGYEDGLVAATVAGPRRTAGHCAEIHPALNELSRGCSLLAFDERLRRDHFDTGRLRT